MLSYTSYHFPWSQKLQSHFDVTSRQEQVLKKFFCLSIVFQDIICFFKEKDLEYFLITFWLGIN